MVNEHKCFKLEDIPKDLLPTSNKARTINPIAIPEMDQWRGSAFESESSAYNIILPNF